MSVQPIIVVGFMGSGKTTVAEQLAHHLRRGWTDLDELIAQHEQRKPGEIIRQDGEDTFRELETRMLQKALEQDSRTIIAAGGGAWTIPRNRELIAKHRAVAIWLDAPFELCWKRIESTDQARPMAPTRLTARDLFEERRPVYELADFRIAVDETQTAEEIAQKIVSALSRENS